jgi:ferredoxin--NADP+ reductase
MKQRAAILSKRTLTDNVFVLRFEKKQFQFTPGQYLVVHIPGSAHCREYSIYSSADKPYLEILVKEIQNGVFSNALKMLEVGNTIEFDGPFGFFVLPFDSIFLNKYMFIATGTGISPFNSIVNTYKINNYTLLHGVRFEMESFEKSNYDNSKYLLCTSGDNTGQFHGRVSAWIRHNSIDTKQMYYLCGNANMIEEVTEILISKGVPVENIKTEVFF